MIQYINRAIFKQNNRRNIQKITARIAGTAFEDRGASAPLIVRSPAASAIACRPDRGRAFGRVRCGRGPRNCTAEAPRVPRVEERPRSGNCTRFGQAFAAVNFLLASSSTLNHASPFGLLTRHRKRLMPLRVIWAGPLKLVVCRKKTWG